MHRIVDRVTCWLGSTAAIVTAFVIVITWAAAGPILHYSGAWQLAINTGTTIITFLMVFVIQAAQNRDSKALHTKLDALIRANPAADDLLMGLEEQSEEEILAERERLHESTEEEP